MTYKQQLEKSKKKLYQKAIAIKILDLMDKLRMENNDNSSKRWAYELIQNACDTAFADEGIDISITLDENYLSFSHNGMPFTAETLTFLAEQISSKDRNKQQTGKFGTGFLCTHKLSEIVEVEGVIKEPEHPHKRFSIILNRSGRSLEQVINSIDQTLSMLRNLDSQPDILFDQNELNTIFRYKLSGKGYEAAKAGIKDLQTSIPYLLLFNSRISSVTVNDATYKPLGVSKQGDVDVFTITNSKSQKHQLAFLQSENCTVALPVNGNKVLELPKNVSRLFCNYPLSDSLDLPVVINSNLFNPNEHRSGVYLTDVDEQQVAENKKLMHEAIGLYQQLINMVSHWSNAHHLCIISVEKREWLSEDWFRVNVVEPIRKTLLSVQIVGTDKGNKRIEDCMFPCHEKKDVRDKLWELCNNINDFTLPLKKHLHHWYQIKWPTENRLTLQGITDWIHDKSNLKELSKALSKSLPYTRRWLNQALELITSDEKLLYKLNTDDLSIIPNQSGDFAYACDLYFDKISSRQLIDICAQLGYDFREVLSDKQISIKLSLKAVYDQDISAEISKLTEIKLAMIDRDRQTTQVLRKLYMWFNENKGLGEELFPRLYAIRHRLITDDEVAATFQKAKILDDLFNGTSPDEIRSTLNQMIKGDLLIDESSEKTRASLNDEAKQMVIDLLIDQGYNIPDELEIDFTFLHGITNPDGTTVTIIVKSALSGKLYLSHREWLAMTNPDAELYVLYKSSSVKRVTLESLLTTSDTLHVRIESKGLNKQSFQDFFQHIPCKFIFQSPASASDYLNEFGFKTRKS